MSVINDNELSRQIDEESKRLQHIPQDMVQYLRDLVDQKISTGKISAVTAAKVREEWANKFAWHEKKIEEHDHEFVEVRGEVAEVKGFAAKLRRALFGVVK